MTAPPTLKTTDTRPTDHGSASLSLNNSDEAETDDAHAHEHASLLGAWRWWLPIAIVSLALALLFADPFAGDWDALDYTVLAIRGEPSTMLFGRMLFIFTNHFAYKLAHAVFGLRPEHAYLLFKYMVVCEAPLAVVALWTLARDLTDSARAATVAALMLALSPFYVLYSGQAMTEIPSLLLLSVALTIHLRGLRRRSTTLVLVGAALLGTGNNVREVAALYGVWLLVGAYACGWRFRPRDLFVTALACTVFFVCAFAPFLSYYLGDIHNYRAGWYGWVDSMRSEESVHPVRLKNFAPLFFFFFVAAPLALATLPFAAFKEWRSRGFSPLLALALVGVFANLMLVTHYSTIINGRYLLTGLPGVTPLA
ncbi:MAG: glycosyltransferase family 39 protein, partial [Pyrinomonadaceae bacterium]